jgi:predicted alpha/beta-fold hydrolase
LIFFLSLHNLLKYSDMLQYVKHVAYSMASKGWNVVVSNHRGLGGVSITVSYIIEMSSI